VSPVLRPVSAVRPCRLRPPAVSGHTTVTGSSRQVCFRTTRKSQAGQARRTSENVSGWTGRARHHFHVVNETERRKFTIAELKGICAFPGRLHPGRDLHAAVGATREFRAASDDEGQRRDRPGGGVCPLPIEAWPVDRGIPLCAWMRCLRIDGVSVAGDNNPGGIGEALVPTIAPAVCKCRPGPCGQAHPQAPDHQTRSRVMLPVSPEFTYTDYSKNRFETCWKVA
jgi:hypothetical protein